MSRRFVRDTAIGSMLGVPENDARPVSKWKLLWEYTGGAFIEGLTGDDSADENIPSKNSTSDAPETSEQILESEQNLEISEPYVYSPLPRPGACNYIRQLQLLPGSPEDDVRCNLYPVVLGDCPEYEALSYCWGDISDTTPIQINDQTLYVTKTLRSALFHLRKLDRPRTLWVDALCINQRDFKERSQQVSLMREIYLGACRTVVWMGPSEDESDSAFDICDQLAVEAQSLESHPESSSRDNNTSNLFEIYKNDSSVPELLGRPWWRRVWIVQEIVHASDALIVCGDKELDWRSFCLAIERGISSEIWAPMFLGLAEVNDFSYYRSIINIQKLPEGDELADRLLGLLIHVRNREASEPRDKVFSVLGLLDGDLDELGIVPDYESPLEDVFKITAISIIRGSSNLDILGLAVTNANSDGLKLPSWAPNWSNTRHIPNPLRFNAHGKYRPTTASRGSSINAEFLDDENVLVLCGHGVDYIGALAEVLQDENLDETEWENDEVLDDNAGAFTLFKSAFKDFGVISSNLLSLTVRLSTYINWETFANISRDEDAEYWQTLCGVCTDDNLASTEALYREWHASLAPVRSLVRWRADRIMSTSMFKSFGFMGYLRKTWVSYPEFGKLVAAQATGRRLGRTKKGSLCLAPAETREGDSIVLVKGARFPLIIRSADEENDRGKFWTLVGECYVHGIMEGEAFEEDKCVEILLC